MIERYATPKAWAEWFERNDGVRISCESIRNKLKAAGRVGESAKGEVNHVFRNNCFSEKDVREICADLLRPMPQADENSFLVLEGVRYGTVNAWSQELGISRHAIILHLSSLSCDVVRGRSKTGNIRNFYPEAIVRQVCADLLRPMPLADKNGFFVQDGIRHGTIFAWSREFKVSVPTVIKRFGSANAPRVRCKVEDGNAYDFYPEPFARKVCGDLLRDVPKADKSGLFILDGIRHGTAKAWSREMGISEITIVSRLRSANILSVEGKQAGGRPRKFYSESDVQNACAELLKPMPQADESGFFVLREIRYGTTSAWSSELGISSVSIETRLNAGALMPAKGKDVTGRIHMFFPEPAVRGLCADFLGSDLPCCNKEGFAMVNGVRYRTIGSLALLFGTFDKAISSRLKSSGVQSVRGRAPGGQLRDLWPEPQARELCVDLLDPSLPQCGSDGFVDIGGIRHGTVPVFACHIGSSGRAIFRRLALSGITPVRGKAKSGNLTDLYPEPAIRELCADLMAPLPVADKDGFVTVGGVRHGTVPALSRLLGISTTPIVSRIESSGIKPIRGKMMSGQIHDFYSEPKARDVCEDLLNLIPKVSTNGFVDLDGIHFGLASAWSYELGIPMTTIKRYLSHHTNQTIKGKDSNDHLRDLYPEPAIREMCENLLRPLPHVNEDGFFEKDGVRYRSIHSIASSFGVDRSAIMVRLQNSGIVPIQCKVKNGRVRDLYPEPAVRELCRDVIRRKKSNPKPK
jgi:hypothetical protein